MIQLGDITLINGAAAPPVNTIIGGSPCQDLSVAGKHSGLSGARSGLFMDQIRIIKEMRAEDEKDGRTGSKIRPRFMVWENVPGAFSSNRGKDFAIVLSETVRIAAPEAPAVPVPEKGWPKAGCIRGMGKAGEFTVAWRVCDAQFFGVPQRRRRIALVADFGGGCAPEILFERKGVQGNSEQSRTQGEDTARDAAGGAGGGGSVRCLNPWESQSGRQYEVTGVWPNLNANNRGGQNRSGVCYAIDALSSNSMKSSNPNSGFHEEQIAKCLDAHGPDATCNQGGNVIVERYSGNNGSGAAVNLVYPEKANCLTAEHDASPCLDRGQNVICLQGNGIDRADTAGCNGKGWKEDQSYTLNTIDRPAVVYGKYGRDNDADGRCQPDEHCTDERRNSFTVALDCRNMTENVELSGTLQAKENGGQSLNYQNPICYHAQAREDRKRDDCEVYPVVTGTLCSNSHPGSYSGQDAYNNMLPVIREDSPDERDGVQKSRKYIVRRLTPLECERLQGFPDGWTDIGAWRDSKGKFHKECSDSARYRALGNSIAIPVWRWVLSRLSLHCEGDYTMASLFDGIGGFPLIWESMHGKDGCLWVSEIDEFAKAVTRYHFEVEEKAEVSR